jgi:hypothetical protein
MASEMNEQERVGKSSRAMMNDMLKIVLNNSSREP